MTKKRARKTPLPARQSKTPSKQNQNSSSNKNINKIAWILGIIGSFASIISLYFIFNPLSIPKTLPYTVVNYSDNQFNYRSFPEKLTTEYFKNKIHRKSYDYLKIYARDNDIKALDLVIENERNSANDDTLSTVLTAKGLYYYHRNELNKAKDFLEEAYNICPENIHTIFNLHMTYCAIMHDIIASKHASIDEESRLKELQIYQIKVDELNTKIEKFCRDKNSSTVRYILEDILKDNLNKESIYSSSLLYKKYHSIYNTYVDSDAKSQIKFVNYNKRILSIGINNYGSSINNGSISLEYAAQDAIKVARYFEKVGFKKEILTDNMANLDSIFHKLNYENLISGPNDKFTIYISGHGISDKKGNRFILTYNDKKSDIEYIPISWITDKLKQHKGSVIAIIDACFDKNDIDLSSLVRVNTKVKRAKNNSISVFFASSVGEKAIESMPLAGGVATYSLIKYLTNNYGDIDTNDMFSYMKNRTTYLSSKLHNYNQDPSYCISEDTSEGNSYCVSKDHLLNDIKL